MTVGEALLVWLLTVTGLGCVAVIALSIAAVKVAKLIVAGEVSLERPVPGRRRPAVPPLVDDDEEDVEQPLEGVNRHPPEATPPSQVDETPGLVEVMGDVDARLQAERDQWWKEQRAKGLSDEQIHELEARHVLKVFD